MFASAYSDYLPPFNQDQQQVDPPQTLITRESMLLGHAKKSKTYRAFLKTIDMYNIVLETALYGPGPDRVANVCDMIYCSSILELSLS